MKNDKDTLASTARESQNQKAANTDILINPRLVQENKARLNMQPRRKRRINYAKKIMNDPFLFNV